MRLVDLWVGTPICLALTLVDRIRRIFSKTDESSSEPERILIIELAETGALVIAAPAVIRARELFPKAQIYFLTFSMGEQILKLMKLTEDECVVVIRPQSPRAFLSDTFKAVLHLRRERIDTIINLEIFAHFSTILAYFIGARRRIGFHPFRDQGLFMGDLLTHRVVYNPHRHAARYYISLVEAALEKGGKEPLVKRNLNHIPLDIPLISSDEEKKRVIVERLQESAPALTDKHKKVLINPNCGDMMPMRRWPEEYVLTLCRRLLEDQDVYLVFTGAPDEIKRTEPMVKALDSDRVINMAGRTTLHELIDLYNLSDLLITNDSGPAHFASLTSLPVLVLFGPETPALFGPLGSEVETLFLNLDCSPCVSPHNQKSSTCSDNLCLKGLTPEIVYERAISILNR